MFDLLYLAKMGNEKFYFKKSREPNAKEIITNVVRSKPLRVPRCVTMAEVASKWTLHALYQRVRRHSRAQKCRHKYVVFTYFEIATLFGLSFAVYVYKDKTLRYMHKQNVYAGDRYSVILCEQLLKECTQSIEWIFATENHLRVSTYQHAFQRCKGAL